MHDVFHVSLRKPFRDDGTRQPLPPVLMVDETPEFEVESVHLDSPRALAREEEIEFY